MATFAPVVMFFYPEWQAQGSLELCAPRGCQGRQVSGCRCHHLTLAQTPPEHLPMLGPLIHCLLHLMVACGQRFLEGKRLLGVYH
jgi:hypothetical protein